MKILKIIIAIALGFGLQSCSKLTSFIPIDVDKAIGENFANSFEYHPTSGKVLDSVQNQQIYAYLNNIKSNLLASDKIKHKKDFVWKLRIIEDDSTLNAFCVAGGYIYVYSGLIRFLDNEAQLAGVLAHEIAHADNRHTTSQMMSQYGLSIAVAMIIGTDASAVVEIGKNLLGLSFSREDEAEADACAVLYMSQTNYDPREVGGFFKKMIEKNKDTPIPELFSTHPASENRVADIEAEWKKIGSKQGKTFETEYQQAKTYLNKAKTTTDF